MTPKEKALNLFEKINSLIPFNSDCNDSPEIISGKLTKDIELTKKIALMSIDEVCEAINWHEFESPNKEWDYWNKVKQEINNL